MDFLKNLYIKTQLKKKFSPRQLNYRMVMKRGNEPSFGHGSTLPRNGHHRLIFFQPEKWPKNTCSCLIGFCYQLKLIKHCLLYIQFIIKTK